MTDREWEVDLGEDRDGVTASWSILNEDGDVVRQGVGDANGVRIDAEGLPIGRYEVETLYKRSDGTPIVTEFFSLAPREEA